MTQNTDSTVQKSRTKEELELIRSLTLDEIIKAKTETVNPENGFDFLFNLTLEFGNALGDSGLMDAYREWVDENDPNDERDIGQYRAIILCGVGASEDKNPDKHSSLSIVYGTGGAQVRAIRHMFSAIPQMRAHVVGDEMSSIIKELIMDNDAKKKEMKAMMGGGGGLTDLLEHLSGANVNVVKIDPDDMEPDSDTEH